MGPLRWSAVGVSNHEVAVGIAPAGSRAVSVSWLCAVFNFKRSGQPLETVANLTPAQWRSLVLFRPRPSVEVSPFRARPRSVSEKVGRGCSTQQCRCSALDNCVRRERDAVGRLLPELAELTGACSRDSTRSGRCRRLRLDGGTAGISGRTNQQLHVPASSVQVLHLSWAVNGRAGIER